MVSPAWLSPAVRSSAALSPEVLSWHWVFWVNVPIGIAVAALSVFRLRESFGAPTRLDLAAAALISGGAISILLGLVDAGNQGWTSPETIGTLGLGLALMTGFVVWELRAQEPMLPMRLFRSLPFTSANATGFFMSGSQFAAAFLIAQYFQLALHNSPLQAGVRVLPWTATPLVVAPVAGALSDRIGRRPLMAMGMALQGLGFSQGHTWPIPGSSPNPTTQLWSCDATWMPSMTVT